MSEIFEPEYIRWFRFASDVSSRGRYDPSKRGRDGCRVLPSGVFVHAGIFNEGGKQRTIVETDVTKTHSVSVLGYITLYSDEINQEYSLLADGRVFKYDYPKDRAVPTERTFVPVSELNTTMEQVAA